MCTIQVYAYGIMENTCNTFIWHVLFVIFIYVSPMYTVPNILNMKRKLHSYSELKEPNISSIHCSI